jgi:hypothetical protein
MPTPLKSIRLRCLGCLQTALEVRNCADEECPLYHNRLGHGRGKYLKMIRTFCLRCCKDSAPEVRECPAKHCPLHQYRFGKGSRLIQKLQGCGNTPILQS